MRTNRAAVVSAGLTFAFCSAGVAMAQEELVRGRLEQAARHREAGAAGDAALVLGEARSALAGVADPVVRAELEKHVGEQAAAVDPLFSSRCALQHRYAQQVVEHADALLGLGLPNLADLVLRDAELLRHVAVMESRKRVDAAIAAQDKNSNEGQYDVLLRSVLAIQQGTRGLLLKDQKVPKDVAQWWQLRGTAGKELCKLAVAYDKKRCTELAYEVARQGYAMDLSADYELVDRLRQEVSAAHAAVRYAKLAKPDMENLRRGHRKLGRSKGWSLDGMVITAPPASEHIALLVSDRLLTGDYRIEAELQLDDVVGVMQVVLAWRGEDDYCVLEFERPRAAHSFVRIVHVRAGAPAKLAEAKAHQTLRDYFTVRGTVSGGSVEVALGAASCTAKLPFDIGGGVAYGLIRPPLLREVRRPDERAVIRVRNLFVTGL